jgi:hypothetical protein
MTKDEALRLALEALENITSVSICEATHHAKKDRHLLCEECPNDVRHLKAITAIKEALQTKDRPVQVSAFEFVEIVYEKETLIGRPIVWAQWPNKEKNI